MTPPDISSWKLESVRLTVFLVDQFPGNGSWKKVTGEDPETVTTKPQTGEHIEDGAFEGFRLSFKANMLNPYRIDWIMYPQATEATVFQSIGGYVEETQRFFNILEPWLKSECPPVIRLAYGAYLVHEVSNRESGYETLARCLPPIKFNVDGWSDFLFQVNNLSVSNAVNNLKLNELSRWMVIKMHKVLIGASGQQSLVSDNNACRIELDLSTDEENESAFSTGNIIALFTELKGVADQYAEKGFSK